MAPVRCAGQFSVTSRIRSRKSLSADSCTAGDIEVYLEAGPARLPTCRRARSGAETGLTARRPGPQSKMI